MREIDPTRVAWHVSSHSSGGNGANTCLEAGPVVDDWRSASHSTGANGAGSCIEAGPVVEGWHVSSHSGGPNGAGKCLEAGPAAGAPRLAVRDTTDRSGPLLVFGLPAWIAFLSAARTGRLRR